MTAAALDTQWRQKCQVNLREQGSDQIYSRGNLLTVKGKIEYYRANEVDHFVRPRTSQCGTELPQLVSSGL
jgi:hypothetical protein